MIEIRICFYSINFKMMFISEVSQIVKPYYPNILIIAFLKAALHNKIIFSAKLKAI